jgi:hypothetical protein
MATSISTTPMICAYRLTTIHLIPPRLSYACSFTGVRSRPCGGLQADIEQYWSAVFPGACRRVSNLLFSLPTPDRLGYSMKIIKINQIIA